MCSDVRLQAIELAITFFTAPEGAPEGLVLDVNVHMAPQVGLADEPLVAFKADEGLVVGL